VGSECYPFLRNVSGIVAVRIRPSGSGNERPGNKWLGNEWLGNECKPVSEKKRWFRVALQLKGSVLPVVMGRTLLCGLFGVLLSGLFYLNVPVALPFLASFIPNIVLGLLLVFRTNTAYERFWEGRKIWGVLVNCGRNLTRQIWIAIAVTEAGDRDQKVAAMRMLVAFCIATKQHLRQEPVIAEIQDLLPPEQCFTLQEMNNPPLEIAFWVGDYLQQQYREHKLDIHQLAEMHQLLNAMVDALGGCERILKTPIPVAYSIHLKQLLLLYCLSLPFQVVGNMGWWTGPIVALVSFTLFGIEAIGVEIENPFGRDANDLPLDTICATMRRNLTDLISLTPRVEGSATSLQNATKSEFPGPI
jgi:ion channel-forming bestrophin family protein